MRPGLIVVYSRGFDVRGLSESALSSILARKREHPVEKQGRKKWTRKMRQANDGSDSGSDSNSADAEEEEEGWENEHVVGD